MQKCFELLPAEFVFLARVTKEIMYQTLADIIHLCRLEASTKPRGFAATGGLSHHLHHCDELFAAQLSGTVLVELLERGSDTAFRERKQRDEEDVLGEGDEAVAVCVEELEEF